MKKRGDGLHRLAVVLVCLVWPLIWVGGLVTTVDAGMAVPDWPATYGYNMFLYPLETWLFGPFDLLVEHGHRLLATVVGMVSIAAAVVAWRREPRGWVVGMALAVLAAVIFQGILGGLRVVLDARTLAMIHGCFGPAFFAMCTALAVVTSPWWRGIDERPGGAGWSVRRMFFSGAVLLAVLCYGQLLVGAQLRHVQPWTSPTFFRHAVEVHVALAVGVWIVSGGLALGLWKCGDLALSRPARWLVPLVMCQIGLGILTWVVNYALPVGTDWVSNRYLAGHILVSKGFWESAIVTAHVATGSLLIATAVMLAVRLWRVVGAERLHVGQSPQPVTQAG